MVRLIAIDGTLYTSEDDIVDELMKAHYEDDGVCILISHTEGANSIHWPNPNEQDLRSALFDSREQGLIPNVTKVELPDGSEFKID
jgi:hypothetical protein